MKDVLLPGVLGALTVLLIGAPYHFVKVDEARRNAAKQAEEKAMGKAGFGEYQLNKETGEVNFVAEKARTVAAEIPIKPGLKVTSIRIKTHGLSPKMILTDSEGRHWDLEVYGESFIRFVQREGTEYKTR